MSNLIDLPKKLMLIFELLHEYYGNQNWWPSESQFETIVGAILTQNTAWKNADYAILNLKEANLMAPSAIRSVDISVLAETIRPSGYFNSKAIKLKAICAFLEFFNDDPSQWESMNLRELRSQLLGVYGIGPETADDIVLYVANMPSFVIDSYTQRIISRVIPNLEVDKYDEFKALFENHLPRDAKLFNEYHALLDTHAKELCHKKIPSCNKCPLMKHCGSFLNHSTGKFDA